MNKVVANREVRTEVSQTAVSVLILRFHSGQAEQKLHTEAIRSDEVPHAAEVQSFPFILERKVSTEMVDVAAIGTRIFTLPREVSNHRVMV